MGTLGDRIGRLDTGVLVTPRRARAIEADALARLARSGLAEDDPRLARLGLAGRTVAGGRRSVEVVEIRAADTGVIAPDTDAGPALMYGLKTCHGAEPDSAVLASRLGVGPTVLDVSDGVITEEYFPEATNLRHRRPGPDLAEPLGRAMARVVTALVRPDAGDLLLHKDEQPEHLFVLGDGRDLRLRLIDWGRADRWPMDRLDEWFAAQGYWLHTYLAGDDPAVWRTFAAALDAGVPDPPGRERLGRAYLALVRQQTAALGDPMRRRFALAFLEFSVRCGPLPLDLGWFNRFVADHAHERGDLLAQAFENAIR